MNPLELTSFITFLANYIACNITDIAQLGLLGNLLNQLGDTISTIAIQKDICKNLENKD